MNPKRLGNLALVFALLGGCSSGSEEPKFDNPLNPGAGKDLPVPEAIQVLVGSNIAQLSWSLPLGETADAYAVFREETTQASPSDLRLLGEVLTPSYRDAQVRNSRSYSYQIAAKRGGVFGRRSSPLEVRPVALSMVIAGDAPFTRDRSVQIAFGVDTDFESIQMSEDSTFAGAAWRPFTPTVSWILGAGDGDKRVHARVRLRDGTETFPVTDSIILDTGALILGTGFDGSPTRTSGETVHFWLNAGEPDGRATIEVTGLLTSTRLEDNGTHGDAVAGDGMYERDLILPAGTSVVDATVIGRFTDRVGNDAGSMVGSQVLTVREPVEPVELLDPELAEPPDPVGVRLRWTRSLDSAFRGYLVYRSTDGVVDSTDRLLTTITSAGTVSFQDATVTEGESYSYRVFLEVSTGGSVGSNTVAVTVPNVRPPEPVDLLEPDGVSTDRLGLRWTRSEERDFAAYRIRRNTTGAVTESDSVVAEIQDQDRTYFDDSGLRENTSYFYRVYVVDEGGLSTRSNEDEAQTRNEPPAAVVMELPVVVDSTAVSVSWSESTAHDFSLYRLYRSLEPSVGTGSTLVVEIDVRDTVRFRDRDLTPGTTYYYRMFVRDDGENPGPEQTGSNTVAVSTPGGS